ncbi:MAG: type II toxin-antitoxin system HicB family antitoxin [Bacillota bacterium]|jgi:predicted RNase H-like HicB family nuclease
MKLIYPACLYPCEEGGYTVVFPDLPGCVTEGDTLEDALDMAADAACGWILGETEDDNPFPSASDIKGIIADEYKEGFTSLIPLDMEKYAKNHSNKSVNKTLTIPAWLNTAAEKENVNFSQVLQEALAKKLDAM